MRICLIGLPRCGSQYISELINRNIFRCLNLNEPFTPGHFTARISVDHNKKILASTDTSPVSCSYDEQIESVINILKDGNIRQPVLLKLFLTTHYSVDQYKTIIKTLSDLNFIFILIRRENILDHILSFAISSELDFWSNYNGASDDRSVVIKRLDSIDFMCDQILNFDNYLQSLNLENIPTLRYEHIKEDIEKIFQTNISLETNIRKISDIPSTDRILNIDEVRGRILKKIKL